MRDRFPFPYTIDDARDWVRTANDPPVSNFAIAVAGNAVGGLGLLLGSDVFRRSAEIGYWLGTEYQRRGIVSSILPMFTRRAFTEFDLCRIYAGVFETNQPSMRVLERAGFVLEGIHRKAVTKNGHTLDYYMYALTHD